MSGELRGRAVVALIAWPLVACLHARPAPDEKIEPTPARLERGAYLANHAFACVACHARDTCWDEEVGVPGRVCATNLTDLRAWSDGEIMRAIREGIDRDGRGLFPLMPYRDYAAISDEDTRAIVAYLRTLEHERWPPVPEKRLNFPVGIFIRLVPRPLEGPVAEPQRSDAVAYGKYLAKVCVRCHSPVDSRGRILEGKQLTGGQEFKLRGGAAVTSTNLLASPLTREQFVARFAGYKSATSQPPGTVMPWLAFAGMTADDLEAIYAFLDAERARTRSP